MHFLQPTPEKKLVTRPLIDYPLRYSFPVRVCTSKAPAHSLPFSAPHCSCRKDKSTNRWKNFPIASREPPSRRENVFGHYPSGQLCIDIKLENIGVGIHRRPKCRVLGRTSFKFSRSVDNSRSMDGRNGATGQGSRRPRARRREHF